MYSALYRIEYESFTNEDARMGVRTLVKFSSLMTGHPRRIFKELQIERNGVKKGTLPILSLIF
jgi:hypothetical protein